MISVIAVIYVSISSKSIKTDYASRQAVRPNTAMQTWESALQNRTHSAAKWIAIGESVVEGQGAPMRSSRWLDLTATKLRKNYPTPNTQGGESYTPAIYRVGPPDSPWTNSWDSAEGSITPEYTVGTLGYRALKISDNAHITYSLYGDSADIWYLEGKGLGGLRYLIDGNNSGLLDASSDNDKLSVKSKNLQFNNKGWHVVKISAEGSSIYLAGFTTYNGDRKAGIQVYDSAHGGATAATFLQDIQNFKQSLNLIKPQLITVELGINDYTLQTPPSKFKSQMKTLINAIKHLPNNPSIELIAPYKIYDKTKPNYSYDIYVRQIRSLVTEDPQHLTLLDLSISMPPADASGEGYYSTDGIHPNATGQRLIENLVYASITNGYDTAGYEKSH